MPHPRKRTQRNPLSALSRWKILDNLRRSLTPFALIALLWLSWLVMSPPWVWTLVVIGVLFVAPATASLIELFRKPDDVTARQHLAGICALGRPALCPGGIYARVPAVRGVLQSRRDRALDCAHARQAAAAGVDDRERGREHEPHGIARFLCDDVERAGHGGRGCDFSGAMRPAALAHRQRRCCSSGLPRRRSRGG